MSQFPDLRCEVATTPEHLRDTTILRSICFVHENGIAPSIIFDGNDQQATHFVFYDGDELAGCLRVRWFANFAKYERTCFRAKYRHAFAIKRCIQMTFDHVARKGYTQVLTQAEERLAKLWSRLFGLRIVDTPAEHIAGYPHPYLTVVGTIPASADPITIQSSSAILLSVEGHWDRPILMESS